MKSVFDKKNSTVADLSRSAKIRNYSAHVGLFGRACLASVFYLLTAASGTAVAADTPAATIAYRPGDTVRVFVTFSEPVALKSAYLRFSLEGALPEGQKVFLNYFDVTTPVRSSEREYELTGKIGDHVASGTYQVAFINATDSADLTRSYTPGPDFAVIRLAVRNDDRVLFPDIKSIRVGEQDAGKR